MSASMELTEESVRRHGRPGARAALAAAKQRTLRQQKAMVRKTSSRRPAGCLSQNCF